MSKKAVSLLISAGACLLYGLSFGYRLYYLLALSLFLLFFTALLFALLGLKACAVSISADKGMLERGESVQITLKNSSKIRLFGVVAHFNRVLAELVGSESLFLEKGLSINLRHSFRHIGRFRLGIERIECSDIFGLFSFSAKNSLPSLTLCVLPVDFALPYIEPKKGYEGKPHDNMSSEDVNAPEDLREYREGDSLKRVHWKISARLNKLHVRRFELPSPPECLLFIKLDLGEGLDFEKQLSARDALAETALSIAKAQLLKGFVVNFDIFKARKSRLFRSPAQLEGLRKALAELDFSMSFSLKNDMLAAIRKPRQIGSVALVASHINGDEISLLEGLKKSGARLRLYITGEDLDEKLVSRLNLTQIELCYVR